MYTLTAQKLSLEMILADAEEGLVGEDLLDVAVHEHQGGRGHGGELGEGVR